MTTFPERGELPVYKGESFFLLERLGLAELGRLIAIIWWVIISFLVQWKLLLFFSCPSSQSLCAPLPCVHLLCLPVAPLFFSGKSNTWVLHHPKSCGSPLLTNARTIFLSSQQKKSSHYRLFPFAPAFVGIYMQRVHVTVLRSLPQYQYHTYFESLLHLKSTKQTEEFGFLTSLLHFCDIKSDFP